MLKFSRKNSGYGKTWYLSVSNSETHLFPYNLPGALIQTAVHFQRNKDTNRLIRYVSLILLLICLKKNINPSRGINELSYT